MSTKKTLMSIVLAVPLAFGAAGCGKNYPQYEYNSYIGKEKVKFYDVYAPINNVHHLSVKKSDGRVIDYLCMDDLKLGTVYITKDGKETEYSSDNELEKQVVDEAQVDFDRYLQKIVELKKPQIEQAKKDLK
jgi:hypothetical protein